MFRALTRLYVPHVVSEKLHDVSGICDMTNEGSYFTSLRDLFDYLGIYF
jgi:hypothetical protein